MLGRTGEKELAVLPSHLRKYLVQTHSDPSPQHLGSVRDLQTRKSHFHRLGSLISSQDATARPGQSSSDLTQLRLLGLSQAGVAAGHGESHPGSELLSGLGGFDTNFTQINR